MKILFVFICLLLIIFTPTHLYSLDFERSSQPEAPTGRVAVFLDSDRGFDDDFVRQQITIVDYVRDREQADVHIIISDHDSGSAGATYAISFIGKRFFEGQNLELTYWAPSTNTRYQTREGYTEVIKVGLAGYLARTSWIKEMTVNFSDRTDYVPEKTDVVEEHDPWRNWVFEIFGGGNFSKEERLSNFSFRTGFFADMVTSEWKIRMRPSLNFSRRTFARPDAEDIVSSTHRHGYEAYVVKSISDFWSIGLFSSGLASSFHNMRYNFVMAPAIEWSLHPYHDATRRSITLAYRIGGGYNNYLETTIFDKDEEWVFFQALEADARYQQAWGNLRAGVTVSHHLTDLSKNRASVFTHMNIRLFQGFSLNLQANYELINDLIAIPAGNLSLDEILLARTQQATSYSISGTIGLSYTFGSRFSFDYNPRF